MLQLKLATENKRQFARVDFEANSDFKELQNSIQYHFRKSPSEYNIYRGNPPKILTGNPQQKLITMGLKFGDDLLIRDKNSVAEIIYYSQTSKVVESTTGNDSDSSYDPDEMYPSIESCKRSMDRQARREQKKKDADEK
jgi:hypothetical protein